MIEREREEAVSCGQAVKGLFFSLRKEAKDLGYAVLRHSLFVWWGARDPWAAFGVIRGAHPAEKR